MWRELALDGPNSLFYDSLCKTLQITIDEKQLTNAKKYILKIEECKEVYIPFTLLY